jgi:hypothetical protein
MCSLPKRRFRLRSLRSQCLPAAESPCDPGVWEATVPAAENKVRL